MGRARADIPGGGAHQLYRAEQRFLGLPCQTRAFVCHDDPPAGRAAQWQTTVAGQRGSMVPVRRGISEAPFEAMRQARDAALELPTPILRAIQVSLRADQPPPPDANRASHLRVPLNMPGAKPPGIA